MDGDVDINNGEDCVTVEVIVVDDDGGIVVSNTGTATGIIQRCVLR